MTVSNAEGTRRTDHARAVAAAHLESDDVFERVERDELTRGTQPDVVPDSCLSTVRTGIGSGPIESQQRGVCRECLELVLRAHKLA